MTEFDKVVFCKNCSKDTDHLFSGSGKKSSCYECGNSD